MVMGLRKKLMFDTKSIPFILEAIGFEVNKEGYVINSETKAYALDVWGDKFKPEELIGVVQGRGFFTKELQMIIDPGII